jgi:predicted SprT family Zn-dependent metalloprotease
VITEQSYLEAKRIIAEYEREQLNKPVVGSSADTGGIDKYFYDLEMWESSFYCKECGCDKITDFAYDRRVANGEVWRCKHCKTETVAGHKPDEDMY